MTDFRTETDSLGPKQLQRGAVWGIHTARALENFPITGVPLSHFPELVRALAMVKKAAALANRGLGVLDPGLAAAIAAPCDEIGRGRKQRPPRTAPRWKLEPCGAAEHTRDLRISATAW